MRDSGQGGDAKPGDPGSASETGFDALAHQYWRAWSEALRAASPAMPQDGMQPWQEALAWWAHAARGAAPATGDAVGRFDKQAQQWLGQMQQVAAQFGGGQAGASEVVAAWKQAMESAGGNPFLDLMRGMRGPGLEGFEPWFEQTRPFLDGLRGEAQSWLRTPTFGLAREHQARWQQLALALADYQQCTQAYDDLMRQAMRDAYAVFEDKLAEREAPGRQVQSVRALFDLWIDAAEDAYAKIALSQEFREVYGRLVDAQMRVRAGVQNAVEQASALFGMPTRTELDGAHRKIVALERQVRRLRDDMKGGRAAAGTTAPAAKKPAARKHVAKKPTSGKSAAAKKATTKKPAAKKAAVKRPAAARTAKRKR